MKFYETNWFLWLSLILFAPLGIFILWRFHEDKTTTFKGVVTVIFVVLFIVACIFAGKSILHHGDKGNEEPAKKETVSEEETPEETEEPIGDLKFTFDPNFIDIHVDDGVTIVVTNVEETEEVHWTVEDPAIAYVESAVGNSCRLVGAADGETVLKAYSTSGQGEVSLKVKETAKAKEKNINKLISDKFDAEALNMGSNFRYSADVSKDLSTVTLDIWFEGFSADYIDKEGGDSFSVKAMKKRAKTYTETIREIVTNVDEKAKDATITINFLNGTKGDSYNNDVMGCDVTNDVVFSYVNGEEVPVDNTIDQ